MDDLLLHAAHWELPVGVGELLSWSRAMCVTRKHLPHCPPGLLCHDTGQAALSHHLPTATDAFLSCAA